MGAQMQLKEKTAEAAELLNAAADKLQALTTASYTAEDRLLYLNAIKQILETNTKILERARGAWPINQNQ